MKKIISLVLAAAMVFAFAACGKKEDPQPQQKGPMCKVTIVDGNGTLVNTEDETELIDYNEDGIVDLDEALKSAHVRSGRPDDYASEDLGYGLSITKLWGDTSACYGYYINNNMAWNLTDEVKENDLVVAFVYQDKVNFSDQYCYVDSVKLEGTKLTAHISKQGFDESFNPVALDAAGAQVVDFDKVLGTADESGNVTVELEAKKGYCLFVKGEGLVPSVIKVVTD